MEFTVGQEVAIINYHWGRRVEGFSTVAVVGKRRIVLANKSEWSIEGRPWGYRYESRSIVPATEELHREALDTERRNNALRGIDRVKFRNLTTDQLERILAVINEPKTKEPPEQENNCD